MNHALSWVNNAYDYSVIDCELEEEIINIIFTYMYIYICSYKIIIM